MADELVDYVVVGGGASGSIVAARLAEASASVMLLEAGASDRKISVLVPAAVRSAYKKGTWRYTTEPDSSRNGLADGRSVGKLLGGGGSVNSMIFARGHRADFDGWAKLGATGWNYDSVLPYFKRFETWERSEDEFRGGTGPISVGVQTNRRPACLAWIESARQLGYERNPDYNGRSMEGVALTQVNQRRGLRSQSSREYLYRRTAADLLTVRTHALVTRLVIEEGRAVGVEYVHGGSTKRVRVREEVVIAAGAFGSPRLLLLSGIGPRAELKAAGVDVLVNSPGVGQNLHDHIMVMQPYLSRIPTINKRRLRDFVDGLSDFVLHGSGILTTCVIQALAMHRTQPDLEAPDTQLMFSDFAILREVSPDGMVKVGPAKDEGFTTGNVYLTTRGRGQMRLRSASPDDPPIIEHELLADPDDLRGALAGMKEIRRIMEQSPISDLTYGPFEHVAKCKTDAEWEAYARANAVAPSHPVGTCKVGTDDLAVVDPELRVHGVTGLRVADSSIMPVITRGNTNAPSMMIGERASDLILSGQPRHADRG